MTIEERKEREKEEMRNLIIDSASEIITTEGLENLSIRKIAKQIEYSPAIIYHYFHDKDEIVNHVMKKGYQQIINALSSAEVSAHQPEERLKEMARNYINAALQMPDAFKAVQLNSSPAILEHTATLFKGASGKKTALGLLYQCLKDIYKDNNVDDNFVELTAQVIASATLGLIIKLIIEKDIGEEQRKNLIEHFIKCTVDGMVMQKALYN